MDQFTAGGLMAGLEAIGLTIKGLIVGAVSSFVALRFWNGLKTAERWTTFVGGWALAAWGGRPLNAWLELKPQVETLMELLLGFFGMALAAEAIKVIRETDWKAVGQQFLDWIFRRNQGNDKQQGGDK